MTSLRRSSRTRDMVRRAPLERSPAIGRVFTFVPSGQGPSVARFVMGRCGMRRVAIALSRLHWSLSQVRPLADWPGDPSTYKHLAARYTECTDESCNPVVIDQFVSANIQPDGSARYASPSPPGHSKPLSRCMPYSARTRVPRTRYGR